MVQFISNRDQLADALTKSLPLIKFKQVQHNLNVHDLPSKSRRHVEISRVDVIENKIEYPKDKRNLSSKSRV